MAGPEPLPDPRAELASSPDLDDANSSGDLGDPIVNEAKTRWDRASEWEANARERFRNDLKFAHGDSDNGYQWPNAIRRARDVDSRPCLTMNITQQHNLQIINDAKQNKSGIAVRGTGGGATKESADVMAALIRHIEYQSNAQDAYSCGGEFQVIGGLGVWRIVTRYASPDTFDQEIYLEKMTDPLAVYFDPDARRKDKTDGRWAFVFDTVPKGQFDDAYPEYAGMGTLAPMGVTSADDDLVLKDHVRICEYFRKVPKRDELLSFIDPNSGKRVVVRKSKLSPEMVRAVKADVRTKVRVTHDDVVEWKLIVGNKIVDETVWPGKYIPLVPVVGVETVIDGQLDRKGHTRAMKDGQRMYNYNASSQVEFVALQSKTPWVAAAKAIEDYQDYWKTANTVNHSVLPYNDVDDDGAEHKPPARQDPPNAAPAFQLGMETAFNQLMQVSGQYQNQMGMGGNERTGEAIERRQSQSDTATYHFADNYADAIRNTGRQLIDLIPRVYEFTRIVKVQAEDGTDMEIEINPAARQAYQQQQNQTGEVIRRVFNPGVGEYEVEAGVGPAYGTRREQTVKAMTLILTQNPGLTGLIGDLLLSAMDFKEADEAAIRLKRMVPPQALGQGPSQAEQALQQQVQSLHVLLAKTMERLGKNQLKLVGKDQMREIDVYEAETKRFAALAKSLNLDQGGTKAVVEQLARDALGTSLDSIMKANQAGVAAQAGADAVASGATPAPDTAGAPPVPGASRAPDGEWYLQDPTRRGKYLRVGPLAQQKRQPNVTAGG